MNAITRRIFTPTLAAFVLLLGLADPASAVEDVDGCDAGIPDAADIEKLTATFDDGTGKVTVVLDLCGDTDSQTKYRIHLDHTAPFAGDAPIDCRGDSEPDLCCTTSDDTMMTRVHRGNSKDTGPGTIQVSGDMITYMVTLAELGLDANILPSEILVWADTQFKGISDRAPNTEWGDGCAKPETPQEVLQLSLESEKIVFVTSTAFNGNLGGLAGADAKCNAEASAVPLPGTYTAWLSDSLTDARDRVTQASMPYVRTDGVKVADDFADIVNVVCAPNCLQNAILVDQFQNTPNTSTVWTATDPAGVKYLVSGTCSDWTSNAGGGAGGGAGLSNFANQFWTRAGVAGCIQENWAHLYCFQD